MRVILSNQNFGNYIAFKFIYIEIDSMKFLPICCAGH